MTSPTIDLLVSSPGAEATRDSRTVENTDAVHLSELEASVPQTQIKFVPNGTGSAYWGPGSLMTFLLTGKETAGAFFLAEISVPPGGGPPPHIHHREDEMFYIIEGTLTIRVGGNTITASPGDSAFLPRGIVHSFKNTGDSNAKALTLITPAGLENYFAEVFDEATDRRSVPPSQTKELITRALAAAPGYGLELLPPA